MSCKEITGICNIFISLPIYIGDIRLTCVVMIALSLGSDSLIAFKSSFLTCIGLYLVGMI